MKVDETLHGSGLSSIPGEFRENYNFLSELIRCRDKNSSAGRALERLLANGLPRSKDQLTRRQQKILRDYQTYLKENLSDEYDPPVPAELEASIRIRTRSTWLPWEAEAIRKIERWRKDVSTIAVRLDGTVSLSPRRRPSSAIPDQP